MPTNPNMVAIQTVTVGSGGASSITFTSIPQTYTDLYIVLSGRSARTGTTEEVVDIGFNGAYTNLSGIRLAGNGATAFSGSATYLGVAATDSATANTFGNCQIYIPNYTSSNYKSHSVDGVNEHNGTTALAQFGAGLWSSTSAITSVNMRPQSLNNWMQYSSATLYGVTSAGYGAKATGGIISQDANYYYHTFLASGTFTPTSNITADYLVVAGGGGGGGATYGTQVGGGGGGGGLRCTVTATGGGGSLESALSLTASTNYTVTVGAGGAAGASSGGSGTAGSNSVFSSITSTGGGLSPGGNGGSGGGGNYGPGGGVTNGGTGTTNQGYAGGNGQLVPPYQGGGGGGANAAGSAGSAGGTGGAGVTTSVSGTSKAYAGGGGSGSTITGGVAASGGAGGGGAGGASNVAGTAGTANTGGGGGGGAEQGSMAGGAGGSGIVIVRYAK